MFYEITDAFLNIQKFPAARKDKLSVIHLKEGVMAWAQVCCHRDRENYKPQGRWFTPPQNEMAWSKHLVIISYNYVIKSWITIFFLPITSMFNGTSGRKGELLHNPNFTHCIYFFTQQLENKTGKCGLTRQNWCRMIEIFICIWHWTWRRQLNILCSGLTSPHTAILNSHVCRESWSI